MSSTRLRQGKIMSCDMKMVADDKRLCKNCFNLFETNVNTNKFCSKKCLKEYKKKNA